MIRKSINTNAPSSGAILV